MLESILEAQKWVMDNLRWLSLGTLPAFAYGFSVLRADDRRVRELSAWRAGWGAGAAPAAPLAGPSSGRRDGRGAKRVSGMPAELEAALLPIGGGATLARYELVRGAAYLVARAGSATGSADYHTVLMLLEAPAPALSVRPLPIVDGQTVPNTGIQFKKHPELMSFFLVDGSDPKPIGAWLIRPLREALCDFPDVWLRVEGRVAALTLFGPADRERIDALVATADAFFAEYGSDEGASLLGPATDPDAPNDPSGAKAPKKDASAKQPAKKPAAAAAKEGGKTSGKATGGERKEAGKAGAKQGGGDADKDGASRGTPREKAQAAALAGPRPAARQAGLTFILPVVLTVYGLLLSALGKLDPGLPVLGGMMAATGVVVLFSLARSMLLELSAVTRDPGFRWWLPLVPVVGIVAAAVIVPKQVAKAKEMLGVRKPVLPPAAYALLFHFALARDLNDLAHTP